MNLIEGVERRPKGSEQAVLAEVAEVAASMGGSSALGPCPVVASVVRILAAQADPWELGP